VSDARIGVVVLTHDRPDELARTLRQLQSLPEAPRIVVVDNASQPPATVARRGAGVELVRLRENAGAAGRNAGVARLDTHYVAFCDDDTWWAPGMLGRAADLLDAHPTLGLVTGRVLVGPEERLDPTCVEMAHSPLTRRPGLPGQPVLGFLCAASVVRRSAYLAAGGFEPRFFLGGEEALLALDLAAAGFGLAYVDDVVVHHHPSPRRKAADRRRLLLRNALWCAWLRRPAPSALRRTLALLGQRPRRDQVPAMLQALAGLPWILRHRRVVPDALERELHRLESTDGRGW
jgi:N-acetylglucosaminyl-diphospho-decaprenol L-rhamnosyltransferase